VAKQKILYGSIVHVAEVTGTDGKPAGPHYGVVLNEQASIDAGDSLRLAMVSINFSYPLDPCHFPLENIPGKPGGHPKTGMSQACAIQGDWLRVKSQADVSFRGKRAPVALVNKVEDYARARIAAIVKSSKGANPNPPTPI
jgi:hypothetical protein